MQGALDIQAQHMLRAICAGFFWHAVQEGSAGEELQDARRGRASARSPVGRPQLPQWCVDHIIATREYLQIEPQWLVEVAPEFYKVADKLK